MRRSEAWGQSWKGKVQTLELEPSGAVKKAGASLPRSSKKSQRIKPSQHAASVLRHESSHLASLKLGYTYSLRDGP